jgi:hypothetical protein
MWFPESLLWDAGGGISGTGHHQVGRRVRFLSIAVVVR